MGEFYQVFLVYGCILLRNMYEKIPAVGFMYLFLKSTYPKCLKSLMLITRYITGQAETESGLKSAASALTQSLPVDNTTSDNSVVTEASIIFDITFAYSVGAKTEFTVTKQDGTLVDSGEEQFE